MWPTNWGLQCRNIVWRLDRRTSYVISTFWREKVHNENSQHPSTWSQQSTDQHIDDDETGHKSTDFLLATSDRLHNEKLINDYRPAQRHMDDNEGIQLHWLRQRQWSLHSRCTTHRQYQLVGPTNSLHLLC